MIKLTCWSRSNIDSVQSCSLGLLGTGIITSDPCAYVRLGVRLKVATDLAFTYRDNFTALNQLSDQASRRLQANVGAGGRSSNSLHYRMLFSRSVIIEIKDLTPFMAICNAMAQISTSCVNCLVTANSIT